ncbi:hypothetical protein AUEXF2481DRAFT_71750 [Aureobasidium subglaciale EXF-2481]|uniref:Enoyl reductase (ER) domain-containing protein n=1 Tax=Aureobasidium subglaciale (strain EXF-2481) TaxID=1043005 RepID=A0A074XXB8_AURSE|nr:uncharacterized protein AUEXF2481DRAFT_71750 [Aureobasidium subglaciale EXF-2481]KAI5194189.1 putative alcohol dehydrogenase [Aureobasidium subglaciale]KAI5213603.1 putative alcohol dehydrogenase [Aureobasidium subglaciale]KAI5215278.1 putative alcohol dehydrogenase [Aureobasidium subglaciale]KAI5253262.1 putative alcohol dehydrogenase [Aureobasidium subglaciale]KEQ90218.1 hypothetical protein AUEXF2481DRAFT_71750 [Aureobasidium subglaciale EXF-2481]
MTFNLPNGFKPPDISLPRTQTAIVQDNAGKAIVTHDASIPKLEPDMVLVRVTAVSINPCDWKMPAKFPTPGAKIGCDFSGVVIAIGPDVLRTSHDIALGDRVCGGVHGSNPIDTQTGAFAQYVAAYGDLLLKLPDHIDHVSGAVLGASVISTLSIVLHSALRLEGTLEKPVHPDKNSGLYVLVYGGSTSTGTMAIQLLKLSGYKPITTCSPRNNDLVRSFGAEAVFDYRSPSCADDIRTFTSRSLSRVLDVITDARSQIICGNAFGRTGGSYTVLELPDPDSPIAHKRTVDTQMVVGLAATGKQIALDHGYERAADPQLRQQAAKNFSAVQILMDNGQLRIHPARVVPGSFQGIVEGLKILSEKATSGEKLVCFVDEREEALHLDRL